MNEHAGGAVIPTGFDVPVEPLRRAAHYTGEPGCIAEARSFAAHFVGRLRTEWCATIDPRAEDEVLLVVSELVTNALRYAPGPVLLQLRVSGGTVEIAVWDSDPVLPTPRAPDPTRVGQHGLEIVRAVAEEFEVVRAPVGKRIVARLGLTDAP